VHLVTGSSDGTGMVWEVYPGPGAQAKPLGADDSRRLWDALADKNPEKAFAAVCRLRASPAEAVALIGPRLKPVPFDAERVKRLLAQLDAEQFVTREAAAKELAEPGEEVEPLLRQALKGDPSPETRKRIEDLLARIEETAAGPAGLQRLRALEVLEHAGTPEAKQLLERLAEAAKGPRLSGAARAVLERLARQPDPAR
jgi:HEAT repeat protein